MYVKYLMNVIKRGLTYRFEYFMKVVGNVVAIIVQYYIWKALLSAEPVQTVYGDIGFGHMVTYIVVSGIMRIFMRCSLIGNIDNKVKTGNIALDLVKPVNLKTLFLCDLLGESLYHMFFLSVPTMLLAGCLWEFYFPPLERVIIFTVSLINSFLLYFLICYIIGILAFWITQVWVLGRVLNDIISIFSGAIIPLWFFPNELRELSVILPFQYIYFSPISIFVGIVTYSEIIVILFMQWIWIMVFYCIGKIVWGLAVKKITIQGG